MNKEELITAAETIKKARWANKRWIYKSVPFAEYDPHYRGKA